ncbi:MAG: response regulator [Syntrophobacteraceae bacterium]
MPPERKEVVVLIADDDPDDRLLVHDAFKDLGFRCCLRFVEDGVELMSYLCRREGYRDPETAPTPDLILLDLNMPRMDGHDALKAIRSKGFKTTPVVMLSTAGEERLVLKSYELGANAFVRKPQTFDGLKTAIDALKRFWIELAELPPKQF